MVSTSRPQLETIVRQTLLLDDDAEAAAAAADIQVVFERCLLLVNVDEGASIAAQRKVLEKLTPADLRSAEIEIDHAVLARIGMFLRDGPLVLFSGEELPDDIELGSAIAQAYLSLDPVRRGRSSGTSSLATEQLALGLAHAWREWTQRQPTRQVLLHKDSGRYSEGGPFHRFVTEVLAAVPPELRTPRKGKVPSADHVVRSAVQALRDADERDSEPGKRGLIDDSAWLGKPKS